MSDLDHNTKVGISTDELSQRRRALLKGSAVAIPAILTLRSGSALAATSVCGVQNYKAISIAPTPVLVTDDSWFRIKTRCRNLSVGSIYQDPFNATKWYKNDRDNSRVTVAYIDSDLPNKKMKQNGTGAAKIWTIESDCYVLAQVDVNGNKTNVVGLSTSTSGFLIAADSCYCSIHPGSLECIK